MRAQRKAVQELTDAVPRREPAVMALWEQRRHNCSQSETGEQHSQTMDLTGLPSPGAHRGKSRDSGTP